MDRRQFIRCAAAASAASLAARGAENRKRLRCGLYGLDHAHGLDVLNVLKKSPDYELVGVCEPDESVRAPFESSPAMQGVAWLTRNELLEDDSISVIAVESRVSRLLGLTRDAVEAGKHVHMDKPAGASLTEFESILAMAERKSLLFQMGYMFRYNPGFDFIRRALKEGWLGKIYSINASICTDLDAAKRERIAQFPGGLMFELGCHLLDMIVLLLGAPAKVTPFIRHDATHADTLADNTLAVLEYPHTIATVESAAMEPQAFATRRFKVAGDKGSIILNPLEPPSARLTLREPAGGYDKGTRTVSFDDLERHVLDFADLAACIRGERPFAYTKEHDLLVQRTVLQASGMLGTTNP